MPPLFVVGQDGKPELVNYRAYKNVLIVDRLFAAAELASAREAAKSPNCKKRREAILTDNGQTKASSASGPPPPPMTARRLCVFVRNAQGLRGFPEKSLRRHGIGFVAHLRRGTVGAKEQPPT